MKNIFTYIILFTATLVFAQKGTIRGKVFEQESGYSLPGAVVAIPSTGAAVATDFDGNFNLMVEPGTYTIAVSFISFETKKIEGIIVKPGEVNNIGEAGLSEAALGLKEVVVKIEAVKNSENAMLTMKMRSTQVIDGISSANLRKIGDSDAASSMKRVPGASVQDGKYVFVRGLGDRYTKTVLNGVDIPGLDPDRNTLQMDIFPTNVIDNLVVLKSFTAELPADFTGGIINIDTKDFPEEKSWKVSAGGSYNPNFHFNSNYLTYEGGGTDFLGYDDGTREIPSESNKIPQFAEVIGNPNSEKGEQYQSILKSFNPIMAAQQKTSFMDFDLGTSFGNQINDTSHNITHGYNFAIAYKNSTDFYQDVKYKRWGLDGDISVYEMDQRESQIGSLGINNVLVSGLAGYSVKTTKSKYGIKLLHLQNGESKAGIFDFNKSNQGADFYGVQHNLEYSQRSLTNALISGEFRFDSSDMNLSVKISPTFSRMDDPDIRFTRYEIRDDDFVLGTEAGFPERIWRNLSETNLVTAIDADKTLQVKEKDLKLNFGARHTYKDREYGIKKFQLNVRTPDSLNLTGDPNEILAEENLWPYFGDRSTGTTYDPDFVPSTPNQYLASVHNIAGYVSTEFEPINRLKAIVGLRAEQYQQRYTGQNQLGTIKLFDELVLNDLDFFPTINFVYAITEKQNLRLSGTKTIARPSLKELSYAEISDPLTGRTFIGGLHKDQDQANDIVYWDGNLKSSAIYNADMRWEIFLPFEQTISAGVFYKQLLNPIEIVQYTTQVGAFQPRNVGDGQVLGTELEFRKNLMFIKDTLRAFQFITNITLVESRIKYSSTEKQYRNDNAREGQTIGDYRAMAGQSPYLINSGFSYNGAEEGFWRGFEAGIYYNVQGPTLQYVGIVDRPDIYSVPFHSLNFNMNKIMGKEDQMTIGFKVSNILLDKQESIFKSYKAQDQIFQSLNPGINIGFKLSYRIL